MKRLLLGVVCAMGLLTVPTAPRARAVAAPPPGGGGLVTFYANYRYGTCYIAMYSWTYGNTSYQNYGEMPASECYQIALEYNSVIPN